jgi:inward rectifier potassium channel
MKLSLRQKSANIRLGKNAFRIKGISRYDLRDPYHMAVTQTWPQFLAVLLALYLAVNTLFAGLYTIVPGAVANARPGNFADAFFFSFETLATVGYGEMYPSSLYGHVVACMEIICGLAFTAILTGLTFVRFSRPKAKFVYAKHPVVTLHNGQPTLMLRIGNGRPGVLADVRARINVLISEVSAEGNGFRRAHELKLLRSNVPILPLSWTLMHELDETSPLFGKDPAALIDSDIRFYVTLEARDPSLGAIVYDMKDYFPHDVISGVHYRDAIETLDGVITLDLARISDVEPDSGASSPNGGLE